MGLTQKQEIFAPAYIESGSSCEAYRQAYNTENMLTGLFSTEKLRHEVTVDSLCLKLETGQIKAPESENR